MRLVLFVLAYFSTSVTSSPVVIKSGISTASEHEQQQDGGLYDAAAKKGVSNFVGEDGFNVENDKNFAKAEQGGNFAEEHADKKHHLDQSDYAGEKFHDQGGGTVADFGNKVAHKKGHHRSGFHNSYHKDESGSNTSYYDDGDDHGDEYVHRTHKGAYGDVGKQTNLGSHVQGQDYSQEQGRHGGYNQGGAYEKDAGNRKNYNQQEYFDDRAVQGRSNAGNRYAEAARDAQEKYYVRPHRPPVHPIGPPIGPPIGHPVIPPVGGYYSARAPSKKTITIYEDPRVDYARQESVPQYSDDYIQLDVKKAPAYYDYRSYDQKPYDDYYY